MSPHADDTQCPPATSDTPTPHTAIEHPNDYSDDHGRGARLLVTAASQWLHATTGRIATCAHSWMQAVHWVHGSGHYTSPHTDGPRAMNDTTLAIAQEISALTECRPGIAYLARKTKVSERSVKYHLRMLREAGLLVYRSKGTRVRGEGNQASVFERIIPVAFDQALGIRTTGEGATRRPVGIAEEGRKLIGKLAKKAARKTRRARRRTPSSRQGRCTPMQGGTTGTSSAAGTHSPSESKLASGKAKSPTPKKSNRGPRKLNKVGRRYQLAGELIAMAPWLSKASKPRIAWIVRHLADAGWTALEVQAAAEQEPISADDARRPSGLLAYRIGGCHQLYNTPARRKTMVQAWQESRAAEQARHDDAAYSELTSRGTVAADVRELMAEARRKVAAIAAGPVDVDDAACFEIQVDTAPDVVALEDLDRELVKRVRAEAADDLEIITDAISAGLPERDARRLYTNWLVDQALAAQRRNTLTPAF